MSSLAFTFADLASDQSTRVGLFVGCCRCLDACLDDYKVSLAPPQQQAIQVTKTKGLPAYIHVPAPVRNLIFVLSVLL